MRFAFTIRSAVTIPHGTARKRKNSAFRNARNCKVWKFNFKMQIFLTLIYNALKQGNQFYSTIRLKIQINTRQIITIQKRDKHNSRKT